jgi:cbb3-type cytochrome oxidase maturation protein
VTSLLVLIPLGLGLLAIAIAAFVWAVRHGQLEDLEGEGMRILLDDDTPAPDPEEERADEETSA